MLFFNWEPVTLEPQFMGQIFLKILGFACSMLEQKYNILGGGEEIKLGIFFGGERRLGKIC